MEKVYTDKYGVHPQLVADTHQYLYRTLGKSVDFPQFIKYPPPKKKYPQNKINNKKHMHKKNTHTRITHKDLLSNNHLLFICTVISGQHQITDNLHEHHMQCTVAVFVDSVMLQQARIHRRLMSLAQESSSKLFLIASYYEIIECYTVGYCGYTCTIII